MPKYLISKEVAALLGMHRRTFRRWLKRLRLGPTVPSHPAHKWSAADVEKLTRRLAKHRPLHSRPALQPDNPQPDGRTHGRDALPDGTAEKPRFTPVCGRTEGGKPDGPRPLWRAGV